MATNPSPATMKRRVTIRRKNELHDLYRVSCERILRRQLTARDLTPRWFERREAFVKIMMPFYEVIHDI